MIVKYKGKRRVEGYIWFENFSNSSEIKNYLKYHSNEKYDSVEVFGNYNEIKGKHVFSQEQSSLITDLKLNEEDLWLKMSKTVRNEINRCERENVKVEIYESEYLVNNCDILDIFSEMYHNMYFEKGMENIYPDKKLLLQYAKNNKLLLTSAFIDNQPVVFHTYVYSDRNTRLLQSCSEFRACDNTMRNAIGRANKYLHWKDIQLFKKRGFHIYDWGGVSSLSEPNGIDKFKMAFGNTPITYFNIRYIVSLRLRIYIFIKNIIKECGCLKTKR